MANMTVACKVNTNRAEKKMEELLAGVVLKRYFTYNGDGLQSAGESSTYVTSELIRDGQDFAAVPPVVYHDDNDPHAEDRNVVADLVRRSDGLYVTENVRVETI